MRKQEAVRACNLGLPVEDCLGIAAHPGRILGVNLNDDDPIAVVEWEGEAQSEIRVSELQLARLAARGVGERQ